MVFEPRTEAEHHAGAGSLWGRIRGRILSGLFLALPFVVTVYIVWFLYTLFRSYVLEPAIWAIQYLEGEDAWQLAPSWWTHYVAPLLALILVLSVLYTLGLFVQSQLYGIVNRVLLRVPVVETIYRALMNVFEALENQRRAPQTRRVVLVAFPQPGMRSLGMVTNALRDEATGRTILSVCVLTGVMPPSGFTLYVPESDVTDLDWTLNQALQSIVSGGITSPQRIRYGDPAVVVSGSTGSTVAPEPETPGEGLKA
jgi:uncharacterized membrane protein